MHHVRLCLSTGSLWLVKEGFRAAPCEVGKPVQCGETIRLEHLDTRKNLHSHLFRAPLSGNQEVSAFGDENGNGDTGDNWQVSIMYSIISTLNCIICSCSPFLIFMIKLNFQLLCVFHDTGPLRFKQRCRVEPQETCRFPARRHRKVPNFGRIGDVQSAELWRPVPDYVPDGSICRRKERFQGKMGHWTGCLLSSSLHWRRR